MSIFSVRPALLIFSCFSMLWQLPCQAYEEQGAIIASNLTPPPAVPMRLQGGVEVKQFRNPQYDLYMANQAYYQASYMMQYQQFKLAADQYKRAGDGYLASVGPCQAMANARYGEAGARMLVKENAAAGKLFKEAVDLFQKYDPYSPFLKAAMDYSAKLNPPLAASAAATKPIEGKVVKEEPKKEQKLVFMVPKADKIEKSIPLNAKFTQLEDGTKIYSLKATDFFNGSKYLLPEAAALDLKEGFVNDTVYKAFLKMDCLEFSALGANYMTANNNYKPFKSGDKSVVIGASDGFWSPVVNLNINGKEYGVSMDLPGISKNSRNVVLLTDGSHVLAIDPRSLDTWKLVTSFNGKNADFSWWKLTHVKKSMPGGCKISKPPSGTRGLFAKTTPKKK